MPTKYVETPFPFDLQQALSVFENEKHLTLVNVGNNTAKGFLLNEILQQSPFKNVFWASTDEKHESLHHCLEIFYPGDVTIIPSQLNRRQYYDLLKKLDDKKSSIFIFEDLEETLKIPLPTPKDIEAESLTFKKGDRLKIFEVFEKLGRMGYEVANDPILKPGQFVRRGESFFIYPINQERCFQIDLFMDDIEALNYWDQENKKISSFEGVLEIFPDTFEKPLTGRLADVITRSENPVFISDDLDHEVIPQGDFPIIKFTTFPQNEETFFHLNFFSVLPFYTLTDFVNEVKERLRREYKVMILTKRRDEIETMFRENEIMFTSKIKDIEKYASTVFVSDIEDAHFLPHSFQNNDQKLLFLTDREIFQFKRTSRQKKAISGMNLDLINSLKPADYVIHVDHGVAIFDGIIKRDIGDLGTREYLKLLYNGSDKLFVPVESAEKVSKHIGDENPRLSKLGGGEWQKIQKKLKKEAEVVAKELLKLYAKREMAKGDKCPPDDVMMQDFCDAFPYDLTPGQAEVWDQIRIDMERVRPMDRLVCGDVGFGKTEMAMRAAFKAFRAGKQVAFLAPITILAEQHYESFIKRIEGKAFGIRVELMSRFQSAAEQKKILKDLESGLVDVVIGTHRLLSEDIKFKKLGLLMIDEEQRFGVKQKERIKKMRANVDLLTLTATPIPRTLHMSLNKLKDISTITTPPPGRLPVVTEVRKYNLNLIREQILKEVERGGQVYFLHNEVRTIEAQAQQLRSLIPEATFIVAHGQMTPQILEDRVRQFKEGEAQVLVASTIIENGIDLANANTLFVNRADKFGLSQLYQLRGRVGRSRTQAYAFFLYHGQKLELDAKKRLRAIVEASELGAGFQIAMRDLEIRGAGEILGASQSGTMKDTGVSHFMRLLHKTVEEMKSGQISEDIEEEENISVEIPLSAFIPPGYVPNADEKIQVYQELAACGDKAALDDCVKSLESDYGKMPPEVENLTKVICLKMLLRETNLIGARVHKLNHKYHEIVLRLGQKFNPEQVFELLKNTKKEWVIGSQNIRLKLDKLPINWYEDMCREIVYLLPPKKK